MTCNCNSVAGSVDLFVGIAGGNSGIMFDQLVKGRQSKLFSMCLYMEAATIDLWVILQTKVTTAGDVFVAFVMRAGTFCHDGSLRRFPIQSFVENDLCFYVVELFRICFCGVAF